MADLHTITLAINRFDTTSASSITVQNAIPLPPGALAPSELSVAALWVGNAEIAVYIEAMSHALHSDGSMRSVYVAFPYTIAAGATVSAELRIGPTFTQTRLADPVGTRGVPQGAALPTSVSYLISCELVGHVLSYADQVALGGAYQTYEDHFFSTDVVSGTTHWTGLAQMQWESSLTDLSNFWTYNYYDRALIWFAQWVRTGNATYWYRGVYQAYKYRTDYLALGVASFGGVQPYQQQIEGVEKHYVLTGDSASRDAVLGQTEILGVFWQNFDVYGDLSTTVTNAYLDGRSRARVIQGFLCAWRLDPSGNAANTGHTTLPTTSFVTILNQIPSQLRAQQDASTGRYFSTGATQLPYMQGMICDSLLKYYDWYSSTNSDVSTFVTESARWLWTQWDATARGFNYANIIFDWGGGISGGPDPLPDLNMLIVNTFGFAYLLTGDTTYRDRGDQAFSGGVDLAYLWPMKAFNENYWSAYQYASLRQGGSATPVTPPSVLTSIVLSPSSLTVQQGSFGALNASAFDQNGDGMTLPTITAHTTSGTNATASASGSVVTVTGVLQGSAMITVTSGVVTSNGVVATISAPPPDPSTPPSVPTPPPTGTPGPVNPHPSHGPKIKPIKHGTPRITGEN